MWKNFRVSSPKNRHSRFDNTWKHHEKGLKLPPKTKATYGLSLTYSIKSLEISDKWPHHSYQRSLFMKPMKIISPSSICSFALELANFLFFFVCLSCQNTPSHNKALPSSFTSTMHITYPPCQVSIQSFVTYYNLHGCKFTCNYIQSSWKIMNFDGWAS